MPRLVRSALIALAALIACSIGASQATASGTGAVSINTASTSATSVNLVITINKRADGSQSRLTCANFNIRTINITTSGAATIPASSAQFVTCQFGAIGVTISQPRVWTGTIRHLDTSPGSGLARAITFDIAIPAGGLAYSAPGCSFTMSGSMLGDRVPATNIPHGTLTNITGINLPGSLVTNALTINIENPTGIGCSSLRISNTDLVSVAANFTFAAPGVNGAPIAPN